VGNPAAKALLKVNQFSCRKLLVVERKCTHSYYSFTSSASLKLKLKQNSIVVSQAPPVGKGEN